VTVSGLTGSAPLNANRQLREIETLEVAVLDPAQAQLVAEVRPTRHRATVFVDRPQPAGGAGEERQRGHDHERDAGVEAEQPGADQPHVVVERQPADEHVGGLELAGLAHRADVREQVRVAEHHPLGVTGAPRGVLQQRGVRPRGRSRPPRGRLSSPTVTTWRNVGICGRRGGPASGRGHGDERRRLRVVEQPTWRRRCSSNPEGRPGG
jgi:hypothetical protein